MPDKTHVQVDVRALADLRARAQRDEAMIARLERDLGVSQSDVERLRDEIADVALLRAQIEEARQRERGLRASIDEVGEGLRRAQAGYWETSQELDASRLELVQTKARLTERALEVDELQTQIDRIVNSRAWRLVQRYRRVVNRLRLGAN